MILDDELLDLVGRTVRVRCAECDRVLGALQSAGPLGLELVDSLERNPRVVAGSEFHARPAHAHVRQDVHKHADGSITVTWAHRCANGRERSTVRRLDRMTLAWVNAARSTVDLRLD